MVGFTIILRHVNYNFIVTITTFLQLFLPHFLITITIYFQLLLLHFIVTITNFFSCNYHVFQYPLPIFLGVITTLYSNHFYFFYIINTFFTYFYSQFTYLIIVFSCFNLYWYFSHPKSSNLPVYLSVNHSLQNLMDNFWYFFTKYSTQIILIYISNIGIRHTYTCYTWQWYIIYIQLDKS